MLSLGEKDETSCIVRIIARRQCAVVIGLSAFLAASTKSLLFVLEMAYLLCRQF